METDNLETEVIYEDVDRWFADGNGFFNNLSEEEKTLWLSKEENLPLGL